MSAEYILTVDAGTDSCKATVFNREGQILNTVKKSYPVHYEKGIFATQDPSVVMRSVIDGIRDALLQVHPSDIAVLGLSGHMNGLIAADAGGAALYPNIIHADSRSRSQAERLRKLIDADSFYSITGSRVDARYSVAKAMWLKDNEPDVYRKTKWFLNIKDYIYAHLTDMAGVTDHSDASLTLAYDINKHIWSEEILSEAGIPISMMPDIHKSSDILAGISRGMAERTGLIMGTPVALGGGAAACAARGAKVSRTSDGYCSISNSAYLCQMAGEPVKDGKHRIFHMVDMDGVSYLPCGTIQTASDAFDWAIANIIGAQSDSGSDALDWAKISRVENMARQIAPGSEGVFFLPTLMGERTPYWDETARGCLLGFTLNHDKRHIARAVYEGIAYQLNTVLRIMSECGHPVRTLMLTGGGARSGLWPDMLANIFGVECRVLRTPEAAASLGAAMAAGVGAGIYKDYSETAELPSARSTHRPDEAKHLQYNHFYDIFAGIYEDLKPVFRQTAQLLGSAREDNPIGRD